MKNLFQRADSVHQFQKIPVSDYGILMDSKYESKKKDLSSQAFINIENDARSTILEE